ncbi:MAG TPA: 16S rRNA (uracil(1498)-N(3))-methyltransferase [Nevskiaceae bacterium]|nr:16S rRNA (uracil(1498)-N(3))-methyltransferase [Nevskiaceae bacterium]
MREPRVLVDAPLSPGARVALPEAAMRHLVQVLRMTTGARVRVFDGRGTEVAAQLEVAGRREASVVVLETLAAAPEPALAVTLAQAVSKGERMDYTLQKAVELGVTAIQPLVSSRSVVRLDAERQERKLEHWAGVIVSACEQCGRATLPVLHPLKSLEAWLAEPPGADLRLTLDPLAARGLRDLAPTRAVTLLVGPEGGLSPEEIAASTARGFEGVRLGPRVLRTETAGVAALAALQALWGDLG